MNYTQAVKLAKEGKEEGFNFLYEDTYKSKCYLALKYMQNEEAAKDVLQEAYIKAFSKLDSLDRPEAFSGWLGTIVANTAKNALQKKNPMLFSDIAVDSEEEEFEYRIEDENVQNQPEMAYTRQETKELVHELIDSLSEEQRMCILMFHIEGEGIREIADALNCSENTVKSRLNYGRKNLKMKAEELRKKGYKLYSMAPILVTNDIIIANRLAYRCEEPKSGDIISFTFTENGQTKVYCKRIIAVGEDTVEFKDGEVYVNGNKLDETSYLLEETVTEPGNRLLYAVPENCVFVLGDARQVSCDSRHWENPYVSCDDIHAKIMFRIPVGKEYN